MASLVPTDEDPFSSSAPSGNLKPVDFDPFEQAPEAKAPEPQVTGNPDADIKTGAINPVSYAMQKTGQLGDKLSYVPAKVLGWAGHQLATDWPQPIKDTVNKYAVNPVVNGATQLMNTPFAQGAIKAGKQFEQNHPEVTADIKSIPGMASIIAPTEGVISAKIAKGIAEREAMTPKVINAQDLDDKAQALYGISKGKSLNFDKEIGAQLKDSLSALEPTDPLEAKVRAKSGATAEAQELTDAISSGRMTFNGALAKRSDLNDQITSAFLAKNDNKARLLQQVRDKLTDSMLAHDNPEWQMANHEMAKSFTMQDLEELVAKASTKNQPANSLDTSINNFLQSRKSAGLRPEERLALEEVAKNSTMDEFKKSLASRGLKYLTAFALGDFGLAGKTVGYLAGHWGADFARDAAMAEKLRKLDAVYNLIGNRPMKQAAGAAAGAVKPMLALPSPEMIGAAPLTDEQIRHRAKALGTNTYRPTETAPKFYGSETSAPTDLAPGNPSQFADPYYAPERNSPKVKKEAVDPLADFFKVKKTGGRVKFKMKKKDEQ